MPTKSILILLFIGLFLSVRIEANAGTNTPDNLEWVIITFDTWPQQIVADELVTLTFEARPNGQEQNLDFIPLSWQPALNLTSRTTGATTEFIVDGQLSPGRYQIDVMLSDLGDYYASMEISPFTNDVELPDLTVVATEQPVGEPDLRNSSTLAMAIQPGAGILFASLAIYLTIRLRKHEKKWLRYLPFFIFVIGLIFLLSPLNKSQIPTRMEIEYGTSLFVSKGCASCHQHDSLVWNQSSNLVIDSGAPDLTKYQPVPLFLRPWLLDPSSIRSETQMPDLGLSDAEVEALILFLRANEP